MRQLGFDGYRMDPRLRRLLGPGGEPVALSGKAFDVLWHLVEHRDQVVTKDELLAAVWPGRVIEENTLTQAVSLVRRALGSSASDHRHIVTLPGRGYRFVAEVQEFDVGEVLPAPAQAALPVAAPVVATPPTSPVTVHEVSQRRTWLLGALLFAAALLAVTAWRQQSPPTGLAVAAASPARMAPVSLAVLPFRSLSAGPRDEGLELGMADTLITRLARTEGLQVRALSSSQRMAGAAVDVKTVGRELGAAYIVEGTTQRAGDRVRINARLLSVEGGHPIWADTFDASIDRVFTVQDRMSAAVSSALKLAPAGAPVHAPSPCDGADPLAYRAYLRGYYQIHRPDPRRMADALAAFREAIDRDPTCARAWAGSANAYRALVMTGDLDPRETFPLARAAVERALAIDPDLAEAHAAKGFIEFWHDWDWARAEASMRHAIALDPNLADAHIALAHLLANIGRASEAAPHARRAVELDPLSPIVNALASSFLGMAGFKEESARHLEKTLELEPEAWVALRIRGGRAMARGDAAQALRDWTRATEISGGHSNTFAALAKAHIRAGDRPAAERVLAELEARSRAGYVPPTSIAVAALALGDTSRTLDLLEQGYRERDVRMCFLALEWKALHQEPRYLALLDRLRLPLEGKAPRAD